MRERDVRNCFDFGDFQDPKVGLPLMESVQRVVIRTEVLRKAVAANRSLEHPAQHYSIHDAAVDAEADDAPSKLIHHDQNPMRSQGGGLASKQVATPQAGYGCWPV
jgi:hypothetical protein